MHIKIIEKNMERIKIKVLSKLSVSKSKKLKHFSLKHITFLLINVNENIIKI